MVNGQWSTASMTIITYVFCFLTTMRRKKTKGPGEQKEGHGHLHGATAGCYQAVESAQTAWLHVAGFRWEVQGGTLAIFNDTIMNLVQCFLTPLNSIGFSLFSNLVLILVMLWLSDYRRVLCKMLTVHFFSSLEFQFIQNPITDIPICIPSTCPTCLHLHYLSSGRQAWFAQHQQLVDKTNDLVSKGVTEDRLLAESDVSWTLNFELN